MIGALVNSLYAENVQEDFKSEDFVGKVHDDELLNSWHLVATPIPAVIALSTYLGLVLYAGPRYMADRKPYQLRAVMMVYNLLQVAFNSWMFYTIVLKTDAISHVIQHSCVPKRVEKLQYAFHLFSWCYFLSKITDLIDTVFMVLRKKQSHVTFLHVYHHVSMVLFTWISVKYIRAEQGSFPAILNMFVHMVMYGYYFLASLGPWIRPYLWWKAHLTKLQLSQFALVIMYLAYLNYNSCPVSRVFNYIWIFNVAVIAAFFINFYIQTYIRNKNKECKKIE